MSLSACVSTVAKELNLDRKDVEEIADRLAREKKRIEATGDLGRAEADLRKFAKDSAEQMKVAAAQARKNAALNILKRDEGLKLARAVRDRGVRSDKAAASILVGGDHNRKSVYRTREAIEYDWGAQLDKDIREKAPVAIEMQKRPTAEGKAFFDDVRREMHELRKDGKPGRTGSKDAQALARAIADSEELWRLETNKEGANIGRLDGRAGPQNHDRRRLLQADKLLLRTRDKARRAEAWAAYTLSELDVERSFGIGTSPAEALDILRDVYANIVTGKAPEPAAPTGGGPASVARGLEQHRVLHFKDAEAAIRYDDLFGDGNVLTAVHGEMRAMARKLSLMKVLGPNAKQNFEHILDKLAEDEHANSRGREEEAADIKGRLSLATGRNREIGNDWAVVTGETDIPGSVRLETIAANTRAIMGMAKLGLSLASQFSDLGTHAALLRDHGQGMFQSQKNAIVAMAKGGNHDVLRSLGVISRNWLGGLHARYGLDGNLTGRIASAQERFFRYAGVKAWTDRGEGAVAAGVSHQMAMQAEHGWADLHPGYRRLLEAHGFDERHWEVLRKSVDEADDGERYALPERIAALGDEHFGGLAPGGDARKVADVRRALELDLHGFIADEAAYGMVKADDRTKAFMTQGTQKGTPLGEALRFLGMFKAFSVAYMQRPMSRQFLGAADPGAGRLRALGQGMARNPMGIASLIAATMFWGGVSMTVKSLLKNQTPMDPTEHPFKFSMAALLQGGGLGLVGDMLFGKYDRFGGGSTLGTLAGAAFGGLGDLGDLVRGTIQRGQYALTGEGDKGTKASDFIRFGLGNIPYLNLHILRAALDIAILNAWQEWASPGTFARRAANLKADTGQRYLVSPLGHSLLARHQSSPRGALE